MHYGLINSLESITTDCLVIGIFANQDYQELPKPAHPYLKLISQLAQKLQESGDWVWHSNIDDPNILLVHCGNQNKFNKTALRKRLDEVITLLLKQRIQTATICLPQIIEHDANWQVMQMLLHIDSQIYQLNTFKTVKKKEKSLQSIQFYLKEADDSVINTATGIAQGIELTKTLADLPANHCTPTFLGHQALELAKEHHSIKTTLFNKKEIEEIGMGSFLAVSQGSNEPPCFIEIQYNCGNNSNPIVLVGKGVTFDSGGLSIKPANAMDEMKYDMAGAASVLGTLKACALLKLPINVVGLIPATENLPSGSAVKPGDIVTSLSGQTIEILNTDAEGRLALADALTYAERFKPKFVIDIATLTGAMVVALGSVNTGFMTEDDDLAEQILIAAEESNDKCWRMPLEDAYQDAIDSPLADMINAGFDRTAGSITAACFLSRFTKKYRWAHLDIAGTAWVSGKKRQATGRPVPLLIQLLRHAANTR
ncbi:aminopeptidase A/I [Legionella beliardensis]|uniref:Probable cytosol aminopeptidase n=1 Tax=Legionella beliardensis TaxID=91822 RepID=A0A378I2M6_9GAMM|nr:leucyl aminopeptidase [Legionella beliardensis]STX29447.1 aminopeptidase A/I [Legionella beliardensis]